MALLVCCCCASGNIICVSPSGSDGDDGANWGSARRTIGSAMEAAVSGDEIWVAAGVYTGPIRLKPGVGLYGGFAGSEATRSGRNAWANQTVLRVENSTAPVVTVQDGSAAGTALDGFTIEHSHTPGPGVAGELGDMVIRGNRFSNNYTGILCNALVLRPRIYGNVFVNNTIGVDSSSASADIVNNTFVGNGAAIKVMGRPALISGNIVHGLLLGSSVGIYASPWATIRNNCVYGCWTRYQGVPDQTGTNGNISADPKLVSTSPLDPHLQDGSPCIDAGNDSDVAAYEVDLDGEARVGGAHVDIGADELGSPPAEVIRVSPAGNDSGDGSSWAKAKRTIGAAIAAAGTGGEVWIAAGTYAEDLTLSDVALYGGFAGNETARSQRDWKRNRAVVTGTMYPGSAVIRISANAPAGTLIDGLVMVSGKEGVYGDTNSHMVVRNCVIVCDNYGVDCRYAADVSVTDCSIRSGGIAAPYPGVYIYNCTSTTLLRNTINGGASYGVSASMSGSPGTLTIAGNCTQGQLGGISVISSGTVRISNNTAAGCVNGAAIRVSSSGTKTIVNNIACFSRYGLSIIGPGANDVRNNCVHGNLTADYYQMADLTGLYGNISVDPLLEGGSTTPQLHIQSTSPCRDAGDDTEAALSATDLDGQARVEGSHIDIGADESYGEGWTNGPVYFVSPRGYDTNPGTSWGRPLLTIQSAIAKGAGDIWVAAGVYSGNVTLQTGTRLYGGFAGWEGSPSQRRIRLNETTITGIVTAGSAGAGISDARVDGFTLQGPTGIDCMNSSIVIANNLIYNKSLATDHGIACVTCPGVEITGNTITGQRYEAIYVDGSTLNIVGNTMAGTQASRGVLMLGRASNCALYNNLITRFSGVGVDNSGGGTVSLYNNCVFGNGTNYSGVTDPTGTNGNISADPWLDADGIHLLNGSPCIDAGSDSALSGPMDCDSQPRVRGAHVDIGADECYGEEWQSAKITYVSPSGSDFNPGESWATAKRTISNAITSRGGEIWVAAGVYQENIQIKSGVSLYGGFAGSETSRLQRDWRRNRSVIEAKNAAAPVVSWDYYSKAGTCLDGFTIRGVKGTVGYAAVSSGPCSTRIANNTVTGNSGIGIQCLGGMVAIVANTVMNNGTCGISCTGSVSPTIVGNIVTGNGDGGIYAAATLPARSIIENNVVSRNSRASGGYSPGIQVAGQASVYNNTVVYNTQTSGSLGGIVAPSGTTSIENNIIAFNSGSIFGSPMVFTKNCVYGNGGAAPPPPGNITTDPKLSGEAYANLHIQPGSPCIDAGDDSVVSSWWTDCDGQARVQGHHVDIGADEFDGGSWLSAPAIVRVSPTGSDSNDGSSWSSAMLTVQAAVDRAGALGGEVWVKAGTYTGCVSAWPSAWLYGGFAGTEAGRGQRDWVANASILDGGAAGSVVTFKNAGCDCGVDGFTIRNGVGTVLHEFNNAACGGGVLCFQSSPTIANNKITLNTSATTYGTGGGVFAYYSNPIIRNNIVCANTAYMGAGVYGHYSSPTITGNTIVANTSTVWGSPCGLALNPSIASVSPSVTNNIVAFNSAGILQTNVPNGTFRNNCVYGNTNYDYSPTGSVGLNDVQADPLFVNASAGDYHLRPGSPCIDAGWNLAPAMGKSDYDLNQRILGRNVDIGAYEYGVLASSILDARRYVDGTGVEIPDAIVSGAFEGFLYIENEDRTRGIRVEMPDHTIMEGDRVQVIGHMATNKDGERYIAADSVSKVGMGSIRPLHMDYRSLGGADWMVDPVTGAGQRGAGLKQGPNTVGLLVTLVGEVQSSWTGTMVLRDPSGIDITVRGSQDIVWPVDPLAAVVTGVCSLESGSPVLLVRRQGDVVVL